MCNDLTIGPHYCSRWMQILRADVLIHVVTISKWALLPRVEIIISSGDFRLMSCFFTSCARIGTSSFVWFVFKNLIIMLLASKCVANTFFLRFSSQCWCLFQHIFILLSLIVVGTTSRFLLQIWLVMSRLYKFPILCGMYYKYCLSFVHGLLNPFHHLRNQSTLFIIRSHNCELDILSNPFRLNSY